MAAQSPLQKVPEPLRRHMHLRSQYQYPVFQQLNFSNIVEFLSNARHVVHNLAPMKWTYLNCPPDGTLILFWQTPEEQGFGSDGYVWGDVETTVSENHGRFILEVHTQRTGFRPGEPLATHARHRYRLRPIDQDGLDQFDTSLWLVHWCRAAQNDHAQSERIPVSAATKIQMEERKMIEKTGVPVRVEFHLSDAARYPTVTMPAAYAQYLNNRPSRDGQPAAKRARHGQPSQRSRIHDVIEDEQEDRDLFDMLTPRDISIMRYTKHSDWMEELMASPFATSQILPVSLGLGRTGGLREMSKDLFDAPMEHLILPEGEEYPDEDDADLTAEDPTSAVDDIAKPVSATQASDFSARVEAQIARISAEMDTMKREHESRLAQLNRTAAIREADSRLKAADTSEAVEAAQHEAEELLGRPIVAVPKFQCLQRGGLVDRTPSPSPQPEEPTPQGADGVEGSVPQEDTDMADSGVFGDDSAFADFTNADASDFDMMGDGGAADASGPPPISEAGAGSGPVSEDGPQPEADWELVSHNEAASAPASAGLPPDSAAHAADQSVSVSAPAVRDWDQVPMPAGEDKMPTDLDDSMIDFGDDADNHAGGDELDVEEGMGKFEAATADDFGGDIDFGELGGGDDLGAESGAGEAAAESIAAGAGGETTVPVTSATGEAEGLGATADGAQVVAEEAVPQQTEGEVDTGAENALEEHEPEIGETSFADEAFGDAFGQS